jgi:hypothetical protein
MARPKLLILGPNQRYWAHPPADRSWQRFWGTYELEPTTGVYVERGADQTHLKNFVRAFQKLPVALQEIARDWRLTFNFAELFTASGNSSTFYADFSRKTKEDISPHIEMGPTSLEDAYIVAHLAHEISHLYWKTRDEEERALYRQFLRESCGKDTVEITEYVHERFKHYLRSRKQSQAMPAWHKDSAFEDWAVESFCDTVATLVNRNYPSYNEKTTVDLATRKMVIASTFGLDLDKVGSSPR